MDLKNFQWQNRLILLFAPTSHHPTYLMQLENFQECEAEMDERDIRVLSFFADDYDNNRLLEAETAAIHAIRRRFSAPDDDFLAVLVGKDGTEKQRSTQPLRIDAINRLIDSMPMRRQEIQRSRA